MTNLSVFSFVIRDLFKHMLSTQIFFCISLKKFCMFTFHKQVCDPSGIYFCSRCKGRSMSVIPHMSVQFTHLKRPQWDTGTHSRKNGRMFHKMAILKISKILELAVSLQVNICRATTLKNCAAVPINFFVVQSCFSHAWLFVTLWLIGSQAPLTMGFSKQEYWSGLPFSSPGDPKIEPTVVSDYLQPHEL